MFYFITFLNSKQNRDSGPVCTNEKTTLTALIAWQLAPKSALTSSTTEEPKLTAVSRKDAAANFP